MLCSVMIREEELGRKKRVFKLLTLKLAQTWVVAPEMSLAGNPDSFLQKAKKQVTTQLKVPSSIFQSYGCNQLFLIILVDLQRPIPQRLIISTKSFQLCLLLTPIIPRWTKSGLWTCLIAYWMKEEAVWMSTNIVKENKKNFCSHLYLINFL